MIKPEFQLLESETASEPAWCQMFKPYLYGKGTVPSSRSDLSFLLIRYMHAKSVVVVVQADFMRLISGRLFLFDEIMMTRSFKGPLRQT